MEWIKIKDSLPDKEGYYLIICADRRCLAEYSNKKWHTIEYLGPYERDEEIVFDSFKKLCEWTQKSVTHWLSLPEPPISVDP